MRARGRKPTPADEEHAAEGFMGTVRKVHISCFQGNEGLRKEKE